MRTKDAIGVEPWIGMDLDGTLAYYDEYRGIEHIGDPIPSMVGLMKWLIESGNKVKIFTARAADPKAIPYIKEWLDEHDLPNLDITNEKDQGMIMLYDDRVKRVEMNTGVVRDAKDLSYHGNIGLEEMVMFIRKATPAQQAKMDAIIESEDWQAYKNLIREVLGVALDSLEVVSYQGIPITIENPVGSIREGTKADGTPWRTEFFHPYGFINNTEGADQEGIDCFIGPNPYAANVYIVHQRVGGSYDEDKVMLGYNSEDEARSAYLAHFDTQGYLGEITAMSITEFKEKLSGHSGGKLVGGGKKKDVVVNPMILGRPWETILAMQQKTYKPEFVNTNREGDYGADPIGNGKFRMVPSGDIVDFEERNRRLKR
jgi:hypothetical protein